MRWVSRQAFVLFALLSHPRHVKRWPRRLHACFYLLGFRRIYSVLEHRGERWGQHILTIRYGAKHNGNARARIARWPRRFCFSEGPSVVSLHASAHPILH